MIYFAVAGGSYKDFWTINGQIDWAIIPAGKIIGIDEDIPIRLQVGNKAWGQKHIEHRHGHWLRRQGKTTAEMLYMKLGQSGSIYSTEQDGKIKVAMTINPSSLLVLNHVNNRNMDAFLTVTTLYNHTGSVDGQRLGRYISDYRV